VHGADRPRLHRRGDLYPEVRTVSDVEDVVIESLEEHKQVKTLVKEI